MLQVLKHLCDKDRLGESGLFSLEQKRPWGDSSVTLQVFKAHLRKRGAECFSRVSLNWRRGNGFKADKNKFRLEIRKKFLMLRVVKY